jgi:hypothetical protein
MPPIDRTAGPDAPIPAPPRHRPADVIPPQAMAHGGTVVRPGAVAWGAAPGTPDGGYSSSETVEQALAAVVEDGGRLADLFDELARARLWIPLPGGRHPVTDGSSVALPTVTYLGAEFVPCFTSASHLGGWPASDASQKDPGTADPRLTPHIVVPAAALARQLPPGLGIALNPGAKASVPIYPEGVAHLGAAPGSASDCLQIRVGHPPSEPESLLSEVRSRLFELPAVREAARAWLSVPGQGEGLIISVTLDDPGSSLAHEAVVGTIESAVATVPHQAPFPIDVTFPGESEPDLVDVWVAKNTRPFYVRS